LQYGMVSLMKLASLNQELWKMGFHDDQLIWKLEWSQDEHNWEGTYRNNMVSAKVNNSNEIVFNILCAWSWFKIRSDLMDWYSEDSMERALRY
jgi:hypothetical protein